MIQEASIIAIQGDNLTLSILCADACQGCKAAAMCGGDKSKIITLQSGGVQYSVGQLVDLELERGQGFKAVMWAYLVPVFLIIGLLLALQGAGVSDATSGIVALGAIVLYYILIKIFGVGRRVSITIIEK